MSKQHILIVDDEPHVRRVVRLSLEKEGYRVEEAEHGAAALHMVSVTRPDALLTDFKMPNMNGRELVEAIRSQYSGQPFPIFVMTSLTGREERDWVRGLQNVHFLEKPISPRRMIAQLSAQFANPAREAGHE